MDTHLPFLFQFLEEALDKPLEASPERGGESNPKEEEPPREPTQKGPYGD
jgi:hypothetical protein